MGSMTAVHPVVRVPGDSYAAVTSDDGAESHDVLEITVAVPPGPGRGLALVVRGELCANSVALVRPILAELAESGSVMTLDLAGATLVGAAAMGMFVELDAALSRRGGGLELQHPDELTTRVLTIGQLQRFLPLPATVGVQR